MLLQGLLLRLMLLVLLLLGLRPLRKLLSPVGLWLLLALRFTRGLRPFLGLPLLALLGLLDRSLLGFPPPAPLRPLVGLRLCLLLTPAPPSLAPLAPTRRAASAFAS